MNFSRPSTLLLALLATVSLALSGCKKSENDPSQAHSTASDTSTRDSAASTAPATAMSTPSASNAPTATADAKSFSADGTIDKVDAAAGTVTISHGPVPALGWQPMTMEFHLKDKSSANQFKAGEKVQFNFHENSGQYLITRMTSMK